MPACLTEANRHYNQAMKICPKDSIGQLGYFYPETSSESSASRNHRFEQNISQKVYTLGGETGNKTMQRPVRSERNRIRRRNTTRQPDDSSDLSSSSNITTNKSQKEAILDGWISNEILSESPAVTSGFSEETPADFEITKAFRFLDKSGNCQRFNGANVQRFLEISDSLGHNKLQGLEKRRRAVDIYDSHSSLSHRLISKTPRVSRSKRRNLVRANRRLLIDSDESYLFNPYALSELFSQSEIPGFREIFASDSYLRKLCWVVAFLFMTVLSLNDMTELITEYYEYPVTVGVRLRDSARLTFPSVTVCNLNVVRFSALCSSSLNSQYNITNQIPSELRERLCGIQVEKKNGSDSDIGDINNIGFSSTTTTATPATTNSSKVSGTGATTVTQTSINLDIDTSKTDINYSTSTVAIMTSTSPDGLVDTTEASSTTTTSTKRPGGSKSPTKPNGALDLSDFVGGSAFYSGNIRTFSQPRNTRSIEVFGTGRPFASSHGRVRVRNTDRADSSKLKIPGSQFSGTNRNIQTDSSHEQHRSASQGIKSFANNQVSVTHNPNNAGMTGNPTQPPQTTQPPQALSSTHSSLPTLPEDFEVSERMERELQENLTNWLAVMYNRDPKLARSLGHQFDDMILRCTMKFFNCTHQRSFENSFSPTEGNCFTYKSKLRRPSLTSAIYDEANLAGINQGLELVLNLEKNEYISGSSQVGALVIIHHPGDLGYAASEATFIAPEFTTYIGLKMVNITRLPAPYPENCVDSWPAKFADKSTRNKTYSQQACLKICLQKTIQIHCQCQSATLPIVELDQPVSNTNATERQRIIICDTRRSNIRQCVREVMSRAAERVHNCECPPKCQVVRYDKTVSMARWPTREDKVTFDRGKMDVNFQNLAKVIIYYQTMTCDDVTQHPVYNAAKLFSALGGIMGMYVGFSFLSVFEIFEVISRKTWHHFRVKLSNKTSVRR